jgi:hypothetical protein
MLFQRFTASLMVCLLILQAVACGATQGHSTTLPTPSSTVDAASGITPVDVVILGLPSPDGGVTGESGTEGGAVLIPGGGANGEMIVPLRQDARAPFNGVLFNGPAVARIQVEFQAQQDRCVIDRRHDVALVVARYNSDIASLQLAMDTQRRTDQVLLNGRDTDIARLNRLLTQQSNAANGPHIGEGLVWAGGGLLLGAILVGGIVILAQTRP